MKFDLLTHNKGCRRLLLIFSGWSTSGGFYSNVSRDGWDVGVITDYSDMSLDIGFLDEYDTIWVFAWSLGVKMAAVSLPSEKITAAFAVNGTLNPVDDNEGIPVGIYNGTADNLDIRNLKKFQLRMSGSKDVFDGCFNNDYTDEDISALKRELYLIRDTDRKSDPLPWRRAFIGKNDRIFPYDNMMRSWSDSGVEVTELIAPHYIDISDIVNMVVPDTEHIARRFAGSGDTYLDNALAQRAIAQKLAALLKRYARDKGGKALEIGAGKGLFTKEYMEILSPQCIDFVDLIKLDEFGLAASEKYFQTDAEKFIADAGDNAYDYVLSSSAVQWFADLNRFIINSARILSNDGILCFSTFVKGNLKELDTFRPSPLYYFSVDNIKKMIPESFEDIEVVEDTI